jgi:hypothetical protein
MVPHAPADWQTCSITVGNKHIGSTSNCDGVGIEAFDANGMFLGVFAEKYEADNAIFDRWDESFTPADTPESHVCVHCKLDPPDGTERAFDDGMWIHARCEDTYIAARMAEEGLSQEDASSPQTPPPPGSIEGIDNPLTIARGYLKRGWNPIPVSRRTKKPIGKGWQHRRLTEEAVAEAFNRADMNVGVQLGPMSNGLTDVDLDCHEAVAIGSMLLPESNNIFGRAGKPRSHWLYDSTLAASITKAHLQFKDIDGAMMLELKIGGGGKGSQSVFPGSTHESGEAVAWDRDGALVSVDDEVLLRQVRRLAVAVMLARHWPETGARHDAALTVGGFLARSGLEEHEVALMLGAIATAAEDEQWEDRVQAGRDAVKQYSNGGETRGYPALVEAFDSKIAIKAAQWLNYTPAQELQAPGSGVMLADFCAYLPDHSYIFTPTGTFWKKEGVNACLQPPTLPDNAIKKLLFKTASAWLDKNRPVHHLTWAPGHPMLIENQLVVDGGWIERNGVTTFNLYRSPTLKHGDPSQAGRWLELAHKVYPNDAERLIMKLAHRVQRPQEKINYAMVLGGASGIGKDTILEPVKRAVGAWNFKEVSPQQVLGRFNGFLQSVIMRINEVRDLGEFNRYQFYEHTKAYFAAPPDTLRVDEKNIPEHDIMNVTFAILTMNRLTDGIYLPSDDRRHDVMWSKLTKRDFTESYWISMWSWYNAGGDGHVAAYLTALDISKFNPKAPPLQTEAFWTIVDANRAPEEGELQDLLDKLGNPDAVTLDQITKAASGTTHLDIKNWLADRKNRRSIPHRFDAVGYVPVHNDARETGLWVVAGVRQAVYAKKDLLPRDRLAAITELQRKADEEAAAASQRKADKKGQSGATSLQETSSDRDVIELFNRPKK